MITKYTISCLDLKQIAESGQCFRMNPLDRDRLPQEADYGYRIISRGKLLDIWQKGQELTFDCAGAVSYTHLLGTAGAVCLF